MILRKPYAFFIRNFRLLHLFLTIFIGYLAVKTYDLMDFINGYLSKPSDYVGKNWTAQYLDNWMFILPIGVIIVAIIIMTVLVRKKKPFQFYILIIASMIGSLVYYFMLHGAMVGIESQIADVRVIRAYKDFNVVITGMLFVMTIINFARASGFDVKKFDFGKDLRELDLQEADREEVEVQLNVDTNKAIRKANRTIRYTKYHVIENKEFVAAGCGLLLTIIITVLLIDKNVFNKTYLYDNYFSGGGFSMRINDAYFLTEDNYGNKITDDKTALIVVDLEVKSFSEYGDVLPTSRLAVSVAGNRYYSSIRYRDKLLDLGLAYENQTIGSEYTNYLLIYEVPKNIINRKSEFQYILGFNFGKKIEPNIIHVNLGYNNVDGLKNKYDINIGSSVDMKESIASTIKMGVNEYEISKTFNVNYNACYNDTCLESVEVLRPNLNTNYDKVLLKINIDYNEYNEEINTKDFTELLKYYGKLKYVIGDKEYNAVDLKLVKSSKKNEEGIYYIEANENLLKADSINLIMDVRNYEYNFILKEVVKSEE